MDNRTRKTLDIAVLYSVWKINHRKFDIAAAVRVVVNGLSSDDVKEIVKPILRAMEGDLVLNASTEKDRYLIRNIILTVKDLLVYLSLQGVEEDLLNEYQRTFRRFDIQRSETDHAFNQLAFASYHFGAAPEELVQYLPSDHANKYETYAKILNYTYPEEFEEIQYLSKLLNLYTFLEDDLFSIIGKLNAIDLSGILNNYNTINTNFWANELKSFFIKYSSDEKFKTILYISSVLNAYYHLSQFSNSTNESKIENLTERFNEIKNFDKNNTDIDSLKNWFKSLLTELALLILKMGTYDITRGMDWAKLLYKIKLLSSHYLTRGSVAAIFFRINFAVEIGQHIGSFLHPDNNAKFNLVDGDAHRSGCELLNIKLSNILDVLLSNGIEKTSEILEKKCKSITDNACHKDIPSEVTLQPISQRIEVPTVGINHESLPNVIAESRRLALTEKKQRKMEAHHQRLFAQSLSMRSIKKQDKKMGKRITF